MGPEVEAAFLQGLRAFDIQAPTPMDLVRMGELVAQYRSFPLGGTDASVVALAERLKTDRILSLDRRHMSVVVPKHCAAFRLLPE
jgi:predicted nucleic acid-binding protein